MESSSQFGWIRSFALLLRIEKINTGDRADVYKVLENALENGIWDMLSICVSLKFLLRPDHEGDGIWRWNLGQEIRSSGWSPHEWD